LLFSIITTIIHSQIPDDKTSFNALQEPTIFQEYYIKHFGFSTSPYIAAVAYDIKHGENPTLLCKKSSCPCDLTCRVFAAQLELITYCRIPTDIEETKAATIREIFATFDTLLKASDSIAIKNFMAKIANESEFFTIPCERCRKAQWSCE
jgi:hypothetical protein